MERHIASTLQKLVDLGLGPRGSFADVSPCLFPTCLRRRDGDRLREGGGFLDLIEAFGGPAFEALLAPIHALVRAAPGVQR
jgi:hypothetical protein